MVWVCFRKKWKSALAWGKKGFGQSWTNGFLQGQGGKKPGAKEEGWEVRSTEYVDVIHRNGTRRIQGQEFNEQHLRAGMLGIGLQLPPPLWLTWFYYKKKYLVI